MNDEIRVITPYEWTDVKEKCAIKLAMGMKKTDIARQLSISRQSIYSWLEDVEFAQEVDRLSVMYGLASKAERMRIINAAARQL